MRYASQSSVVMAAPKMFLLQFPQHIVLLAFVEVAYLPCTAQD